MTAEPSAPPLEAAVTHAGEAPPAYHTAVLYKTVDPASEDVRLSKDLAISEHHTSAFAESVAPPAYKEPHMHYWATNQWLATQNLFSEFIMDP